MTLEEVETVPSVFDRLLLIVGNRTPTVQCIVQSVTDCLLCCIDFLQQEYWVKLNHSVVVESLPVASLCHSVLISRACRVGWRFLG